MVAIRSTFAVDSGERLSDRFFDVRWMSQVGTPSDQRWFSATDVLPENHDPVWGFGDIDQDGRLVITYDHPDLVASGRVLPMWFVLVDLTKYKPPHYMLMGYLNQRKGFPPGTVIDGEEATQILKDSELASWAGFIRWRSRSMMLQQVTTSPNHRRKGVASTLLLAGDIIAACYGFAPGKVLHGGAITTAMGETLRNVFPASPGRIDSRIGSVAVVEED